jgi:hypothetical protein
MHSARRPGVKSVQRRAGIMTGAEPWAGSAIRRSRSNRRPHARDECFTRAMNLRPQHWAN